jgi:cell division septation protein DedD
MLCFFPALNAASNPGNVSDLSEWDVTSYTVNLLNHRGGSGDIQTDQHGWIHLGANHLEGGDITYQVPTGNFYRSDILEVWIDGYSTSNDLDIGPTVFIGTGKNRFEQITRLPGDAWRPVVFRFADDTIYGDITDPSNRNENWRIRYPSSKYEVRRIDKSPRDLLDHQTLPVRVSITGAEDFIIKRMEVVVYRAQQGPYRDNLGVYAEGTPFSNSERYQVKLAARFDQDQEYSDSEHFEYIHPKSRLVVKPRPTSKPQVEAYRPPSPPSHRPPLPQAPPSSIIPVVQVGPAVNPPIVTGPPMTSPPGSIPPVTPAPAYFSGYTIQIGAYQVQASAISIMKTLFRYGYDVYISETIHKGKRLFRVRVGNYPSKALAHRHARGLQNRGFDTWITKFS